jgi:thiamine-monophosphate kinase
MSEHALIAAIRARLATDDARVELGIGDDGAILRGSEVGSVLSVDAAVEGVHFDLAWLPLEDVGFRSYAAALSDLAAMGARARCGLLSLVLPTALDDAAVMRLVEGVAQAAERFDAPVVGGNVASGPCLVLSSTVVGECPQRGALLRSGAREGDAIYVTGTLGAAALGLAALRAGEGSRSEAAPFVARWRRLGARLDLVEALGRVAGAAIDVSDGLVADLGHLCRASGLVARIELGRVPREPGHDALAAALGLEPDALVLGGGEDYEVAFAAPDGLELAWATRIGTFTAPRAAALDDAGSRVMVLDRDGAPRSLDSGGYEHRR